MNDKYTATALSIVLEDSQERILKTIAKAAGPTFDAQSLRAKSLESWLMPEITLLQDQRTTDLAETAEQITVSVDLPFTGQGYYAIHKPADAGKAPDGEIHIRRGSFSERSSGQDGGFVVEHGFDIDASATEINEWRQQWVSSIEAWVGWVNAELRAHNGVAERLIDLAIQQRAQAAETAASVKDALGN